MKAIFETKVSSQNPVCVDNDLTKMQFLDKYGYKMIHS